jgi:hypothetical protein
MRSLPIRAARALALAAVLVAGGCAADDRYGVEERIALPVTQTQVWAVAPADNVSGVAGVDPLLQADLLFTKLQAVEGVRALPVNRVAEAMLLLGIDRIRTPEEAAMVREAVGADAIVLTTITFFDPYDPPTVGAALTVYPRTGSLQPVSMPGAEAVRDLTRIATAVQLDTGDALTAGNPVQVAGVFDARDGSVRQAARAYASGRFDPDQAAGAEGVFLVMDQYAGFAYHALLAEVAEQVSQRQTAQVASAERRSVKARRNSVARGDQWTQLGDSR